MDRIHYAGNSCVTGTDIARALLDYAQALAQVGTSATVDVPTLNEGGEPGRTEFLVGPASQIVSSAEDSPYEDVIDEELVVYLSAEATRLRSYGQSSPTAAMAEAHKPEDWTDYGV